mgnify:CR=1 FL=1
MVNSALSRPTCSDCAAVASIHPAALSSLRTDAPVLSKPIPLFLVQYRPNATPISKYPRISTHVIYPINSLLSPTIVPNSPAYIHYPRLNSQPRTACSGLTGCAVPLIPAHSGFRTTTNPIPLSSRPLSTASRRQLGCWAEGDRR